MKPKLSKNQVSRAGHYLAGLTPCSEEEMKSSRDLLNHWRLEHTQCLEFLFDDVYALQILDASTFMAGRIKKYDTIINKQRRLGINSKLKTMADIAGARIVFASLADMQAAAKKLKYLDAYYDNEHDYLVRPKRDGYRAIHLYFAYDTKHASGLKAELQLKTLAQHYWSTAVESYDLARNAKIKFNEYSPEGSQFFLIASKLIELEETGHDQIQSERYFKLCCELKEEDAVHHMSKMLKALEYEIYITKSLSQAEQSNYIALLHNRTLQELEFHTVESLENYLALEERYAELEDYSVVLTRSATLKDLESSYLNYTGDVSGFNSMVKNWLSIASS